MITSAPSPALVQVRHALAGIIGRARSAGIVVPASIGIAFEKLPPGVTGAATVSAGQPMILLGNAKVDHGRSFSAHDMVDMRGLLLHEVAHHIAGIQHNHREPFRRACVALADVFNMPAPAPAESDPTAREHPRRWLGGCSTLHCLGYPPEKRPTRRSVLMLLRASGDPAWDGFRRIPARRLPDRTSVQMPMRHVPLIAASILAAASLLPCPPHAHVLVAGVGGEAGTAFFQEHHRD